MTARQAMTARQEQMRIRLLLLISNYPGRDAVELEQLGQTPRMHGNCSDAEEDGDIEWRCSAGVFGWYVTAQGASRWRLRSTIL